MNNLINVVLLMLTNVKQNNCIIPDSHPYRWPSSYHSGKLQLEPARYRIIVPFLFRFFFAFFASRYSKL